MKKYINRIVTLMAILFFILLLVGINYELFEAFTGKVYKYHPDAGIFFGLLKKDGQATNLFYWELDFFRIVVHVSFALSLASFIIFFSAIFKYKRFDLAKVIVALLSIIIALNIPFMMIQFAFFVVAPYLLTLILWLNAILSIVISSILVIEPVVGTL